MSWTNSVGWTSRSPTPMLPGKDLDQYVCRRIFRFYEDRKEHLRHKFPYLSQRELFRLRECGRSRYWHVRTW